MKIKVASTTEIAKDEYICGYGGCSKVYHLPGSDTCFKVYKDTFNMERREVALANLLDITNFKSLVDDPHFILPKSILVDENRVIEALELPFHYLPNMWHFQQEHFLTRRYIEAIMAMIKKVKELTGKGIVISDFKLANMIVNDSGEIYILDNDFSIRSVNKELLQKEIGFSKNIYARNYIAKFKDHLDEDYNRYMLVNMLALLLIDYETLTKVWPCGSSPSIKTLENICQIIKKDRMIPRSIKDNTSNVLTANTAPDVSQSIIDEYQDVLVRKMHKETKKHR